MGRRGQVTNPNDVRSFVDPLLVRISKLLKRHYLPVLMKYPLGNFVTDMTSAATAAEAMIDCVMQSSQRIRDVAAHAERWHKEGQNPENIETHFNTHIVNQYRAGYSERLALNVPLPKCPSLCIVIPNTAPAMEHNSTRFPPEKYQRLKVSRVPSIMLRNTRTGQVYRAEGPTASIATSAGRPVDVAPEAYAGAPMTPVYPVLQVSVPYGLAAGKTPRKVFFRKLHTDPSMNQAVMREGGRNSADYDYHANHPAGAFWMMPNHPMYAEFERWATALYLVNIELARAFETVSWVVRMCSTIGQVHRVWPDLVHYIDGANKQRLQEMKVRSPLADAFVQQGCETTAEYKERMKFIDTRLNEVNELLARAVLMQGDWHAGVAQAIDSLNRGAGFAMVNDLQDRTLFWNDP